MIWPRLIGQGGPEWQADAKSDFEAGGILGVPECDGLKWL